LYNFLHRHIRAIALVTWMIIIFIGSSIPGEDMPPNMPPDYTLHFIEYAIFGGLAYWWAFGDVFKGIKIPSMLVASILCSTYAITDEVHQFFVPGRVMDPMDWFADTLGALFGAFCVMLFLSFKRIDYGTSR